MFGLTLEKMIIIGLIAAVLIGPQRLPMYAQKLSELIRTFRAFAEASRTRAESELGMPLNTAEWNSQLRQYDPRRIVRDAWTASPQAASPHAAAPAAAQDATSDATSDAAAADLETASTTETADSPEVETRVRWRSSAEPPGIRSAAVSSRRSQWPTLWPTPSATSMSQHPPRWTNISPPAAP